MVGVRCKSLEVIFGEVGLKGNGGSSDRILNKKGR
jgi:hypothetical protein